MTDLDNLAHKYDAYIKSDGRGFRRKARILQPIWREEQGIEPGQYETKSRLVTLGSLLPMPEAQQTLSNYLTDNLHDVVRSEVLEKR